MNTITRWVTFVVTLAGLTGPAWAGRVVQFDILVDGQVVLVAGTLDRGEADFDRVWDYLKSLPLVDPAVRFVLAPEEKTRLAAFQQQLAARATDNAVTLAGEIRIFCRYAGDVTVKQLRLVRDRPNLPWYIEPRQVDEMAKLRTVDPQRRTRAQVDEVRSTGEKPSK